MAEGLAAREVAAEWLLGAGVLIADGEHEPLRKGFFLGAQRCGVPSVVLQHGVLDLGFFPMHADRLYTWGAHFQRAVEKLGVPSEQFKPLGNPRWDALETWGGREVNRAVRASMGGVEGRPLVLLISTTHVSPIYPGLYAAFFQAVQNLADAGLDVAVRRHPAEADMSQYARALSPSARDRLHVLPPCLDLYDGIFNADVVYLTNSTTCLEAMILERPVLFTGEARGQGIPDYLDYPEYGGGEWCDAGDIVRRCQDLAHPGPERASLIMRQSDFLKMALENRGRATGAVVDEILSTARRKA